MRWCRGLRQSSRIDERRRKNENNMLTALQIKKKGEQGIGRGKSTIYGNIARTHKERKRQMEEQDRDGLCQKGEIAGDVDTMGMDDGKDSKLVDAQIQVWKRECESHSPTEVLNKIKQDLKKDGDQTVPRLLPMLPPERQCLFHVPFGNRRTVTSTTPSCSPSRRSHHLSNASVLYQCMG
jgi:hypothetical protein